MKTINLREFDRRVAEREGKKIEQSIAQIGETRKIVFEELAKFPNETVIAVLNEIRAEIGKSHGP